jgi:hypothetical protein
LRPASDATLPTSTASIASDVPQARVDQIREKIVGLRSDAVPQRAGRTG